MDKIEQKEIAWYVLRVTYQREITASKALEELQIEHYVPTIRTRIRNEKGVSIGWKTEPLVHNYIFIHDSYENILKLKQGKLDYLRFMMGKDEKGLLSEAQYVPDKQMADFIKVVRTMGSKPVDPNIDLRKGDKVRILTGPFEGVEGIYVRMPNRHEKRVVVQIEGIAAVATVALNASDVEKIEVKKEEKHKTYNI
ncbi:MAG: UpxY family transcription antiterminator [Bacteroidales bacterium]|nr:UpxY family transcription antiterminator [Bacteroidales bacterium]